MPNESKTPESGPPNNSKCYNDEDHRWDMTGKPTCRVCGKTGTEVANRYRQWQAAKRHWKRSIATSKTPETEAAITKVVIEGSTLFPPHRKTYKTLEYIKPDFARKLELSRDEALAKLAAYEGRTNYLCECGGTKRDQAIREEALREAAKVAELSLERKDVRWEYATNVSTVPRDAILSLISTKEKP